MNRGFGIVLAVPILFFCFAIMVLVGHVQQEMEDIEEYVLALSIDYSTDAAAAEMLNTATLDKDYVTSLESDVGYFAVDPEVALTTFSNVMCLNYGIGTVNTNDLAPTLLEGDAYLAMKNDEYDEGDIVMFQTGSILNIGRVVDENPRERLLHIQGREFPISSSIVYGKAVARLPQCDALVSIFLSPIGLCLLLIVAVVIIKL